MIIAAIRNEKELEDALKSNVSLIFDLKASILTLEEKVKRIHQEGKKIYIHIDLAEGIDKDRAGVQYVKKLGVDGIISTCSNTIKQARKEGLAAVQRFFALDSQSVNAIVGMANISKPSMIEIMPGVAYKVIRSLKSEVNIPIIAGGLIETQAEISQVLNEGAYAVSTSKKDFWK